MRVLIVKTSSLGDIIHALPVLDYLHQASPGIEVDWVVEEQLRVILEDNPLISNLYSVRTKQWRKHPFSIKTVKEISSLKNELHEREYNLIFDIQGNLKSGLIDLATGCHERVGFSPDIVRERINLLFTTRQVPQRSIDYHVTDKYLRVVSVPFGRDFSEMTLKTTIATSTEDDAMADALIMTLGDGLVFLFHCGTTWKTKKWDSDSWIQLGKALLAEHDDASILLTWGSEAEKNESFSIAHGIGKGARVVDRYPLKTLASLLKRVDLVVAPDTGPLHIAAAVGTPTVSFYRATNAKLTGPRGSSHVTLQSPLSCTRCARKQCDSDAECRGSVTVEMVLKGISSILT